MAGERILIIEDEPIIATDVRVILATEGYGIAGIASRADEGLDLFEKTSPDLVLMDIALADERDGIELAGSIRERSAVPIIYMTAHADTNTFLRARKTAPSGYLYKPINPRDLLTNIDSALYRHRMEQRLKESEERFRVAASILSDIIYEWNPIEKTIIWHGNIESLVEYKEGIFPRTEEAWLERLHPGDMDLVRRLFRTGFKTGLRQEGEVRIVCMDGSIKYIFTTGIAVRIPGKKISRVIGAITDITMKKNVQEDLRIKNEKLLEAQRELVEANARIKSSEEKFSKVFHGSPMIMTLNRMSDAAFVEVNDIALEQTGYSREEVIGNTPAGLNIYENIDDLKKLYRTLRKRGSVRNLETNYRRKDGVIRNAIINADSIDIEGMPHVILSLYDITERNMTWEIIQRAEKLESLGLLAGGIAHDFNNILMGIVGNISMARMKCVPGDEMSAILMEAENSCLRAKDLTRQLLTFSRGGAPQKKRIALTELIRKSVSFNLAGSSVKANFAIQPDLWSVDADEGQLDQVINNLIINAVQSMPDGGEIDIEAMNRTIDNDEALPLPVEHMSPGNYVVITVRDRGKGIPEEIQRRIFEPYYTTKPGGSGLGLAVVYSIIRNHGGYITYTSHVSEGTAFYLYLPATGEVLTESEGAGPVAEKGHGRILIMDDEEVVLEVIKKMLLHLGYEVVTSRDGAEALDLYGHAMQAGAPFDAVIMDLVIPGGMGGGEAIHKLMEMDPKAKAVVASGYSSDSVMANPESHGFCGFIQKPFRMEELGELMKKVTVK